jgi:two-component system, NarL family, nitrate/nitrite response regulator NarL
VIRILLIDDAPSFRVLMRHLLTEDGDIELAGEAGTVPDGVRLAGELQPDVVLTDVHLGAHNALQALAELRTAAPGAKVVALSGSSAHEVGADTADVDAYVEKAADAAELRAVIRRLAG